MHAPDYGEHKRAKTASACRRSDKQALPRLRVPDSLYILSASGLQWKPFIHIPKHFGHDLSIDVPSAPLSCSDLMHQSSLLGNYTANLSINQGIMATLQERRLGYHFRARRLAYHSRAGLEPGTSEFSILRINHHATRGIPSTHDRVHLDRAGSWASVLHKEWTGGKALIRQRPASS